MISKEANARGTGHRNVIRTPDSCIIRTEYPKVIRTPDPNAIRTPDPNVIRTGYPNAGRIALPEIYESLRNSSWSSSDTYVFIALNISEIQIYSSAE